MIDTDKIVSGLTYNGVPLQMAGSGPVDWGEIGGDIADQEDLQEIIIGFDERVTDLEEQGVGEDGATFTPSVDASGNISWTNDKGLPNPTTRNIKGPQGTPGNDGADGEDGHTPAITATKSGTTTTIKSDGVAIATINDGAKGDDGKDGADGHSPVVTASKSGTVTTIKVDGTAIATINDGTQGNPGPTGPTGPDGHTPVKGTDYWTSADRQGIIDDVLAAIPIYGGAIV